MVWSASVIDAYRATGSAYSILARHLIGVALGITALVLATRLSSPGTRRLGYPLLGLALIGLAAALVPGIGSAAYGARRWIAVGPLVLQPSEPAKLALAIWGADVLVRKRRLLGDWRHLVIPLLPIGFLLAALVLAEPDMGTMMVLVAMLFGLLFVVGTPGRLLAPLASVMAAAGAVAAATAPYRMARLSSFVHPFADPTGAGYQAVQGLYALGSGGWFGRGLGAGQAKWGYLPNAYTDYIYAILGRNSGLPVR